MQEKQTSLQGTGVVHVQVVITQTHDHLSQCYTFHFYIFNLAFFFIGCLFRLRIVDNQTLGPDTPAELATPLHLTFLNPFSYCLTFAFFFACTVF